MAIDMLGEVSICIGFDPKRVGVIGDAKSIALVNIWNGSKREEWIKHHVEGNRHEIPLRSYCDLFRRVVLKRRSTIQFQSISKKLAHAFGLRYHYIVSQGRTVHVSLLE